MTRSTVLTAVEVWTVPNTRCPVSAVSIAIDTVSRSRSSPTSTISGSSRSAARSACLNDDVCTPTCRCVIRHFLLSCTNSIGARPVDQVDQSAKRRRFSGAGWAGHEDEPLGQMTKPLHFLRDAHLFDSYNRGRDGAENR